MFHQPHTSLPPNLAWRFSLTIRNRRRSATQTIYLRPPFRILRQHTQHVIAGDAVRARDYCCESFEGGIVDGKAVIDAAGFDDLLVRRHGKLDFKAVVVFFCWTCCAVGFGCCEVYLGSSMTYCGVLYR
jgi:hypothetical protein